MSAGPRLVRLRWAAALGTAAIVLIGASAAQAHGALHVPKHKRTATTSTNWSGYAVDGTGASDVIGSWTQPTAHCSPGENSWSSPWVGIDGDNSNTVEQIGTDSDCTNGVATYYAWYEMYPKRLFQINMPVSAGESFTGEVKFTSSGFVMTLIPSSGKSFTTTQSSKKAKRSSIEWIMEGPDGSGLTNFGSIPFSSNSGTINGQTGGLSSFATREEITMTSNSGAVRAQPSTVSGSAFGVNFVSH